MILRLTSNPPGHFHKKAQLYSVNQHLMNRNKYDENISLDALRKGELAEKMLCQPGSDTSLRPGQICPACRLGRIEYNSLLNLICLNCGRVETGAST